jgi:hypothetical protein
MRKCIYSKKEFEQADGEHILQDSFGARWTSHEISSNCVQKKFAEGIDNTVASQFQKIRTILGFKGGRKGDSPDIKNIKGSDGNQYHLKSGGIPHIASPIVQEYQDNEGNDITKISVSKYPQLHFARKEIKDKFPDSTFTIEELRSKAKKESTDVDAEFDINIELGGKDFFRGILKSIFNLLGVKNSYLALTPEFDAVREFILSGSGDVTGYVRWITCSKPFSIPRLGEFDHFICVFSNNQKVDGFAQFYGEIAYSIRLAETYQGDDFCYSYLVNPCRDTDPSEKRDCQFDKNILPHFDSGMKTPNKDVENIYEIRSSNILKKNENRQRTQRIQKITDETLSSQDVETIDDDSLNLLIDKVLDHIDNN